MGKVYQKKISVRGEFAKVGKGQDLEDSDIITLLDEGQPVEGQWGTRDVFNIKTKNGEKNLTINQTSMNNLIDAYGADASGWVGKDIKVWLLRQMIDGKLKNVVYLTHPDWEMDQEGRFTNPDAKEAKEINPDDIPF